MTMFESGEYLHWERLKKNAGVQAFYRRGNDGKEITVVPARGGNDQLNFNGDPMQDESKSFILGVSDLRSFFPPKDGDVIQYRESGKTWRIVEQGGAAHTESGNYGVMIRVHSVQR